MLAVALAMAACGSNRRASIGAAQEPVGPPFNADSALAFCAAQCGFGPRVMNGPAHDRCGEWIRAKFAGYGCEVASQRATLTGWDGTELSGENIIASYQPGMAERVLICAHWDSRPWADNDPDSANWRTPVMGANDGASGVAVMLEIARLLASDTARLDVGVDFVCFDAEDWGVPQWGDAVTDGSSWALGAQHWAGSPHRDGYTARFGILLDMVGGHGAQFWQEGGSARYARDVVRKVWGAARVAGYGSFFPEMRGATVTDDHVPVNESLGIPTIDVIPFYPDCDRSTFGPTWHTVSDDMGHIDKGTLKAVGQTIVQVLYSEGP